MGVYNVVWFGFKEKKYQSKYKITYSWFGLDITFQKIDTISSNCKQFNLEKSLIFKL